MMPMADMFGPDINFVPLRAVYPTGNGGTSASAGAAMNANTNVTSVDVGSGAAAPAVVSGAGFSTSGHAVWWWVGLLGLLAIMVFVARKAGGEEDFRNIRPTAYNFLTITLTSIVGIVGAKVLAARYRIPGASDLILAA